MSAALALAHAEFTDLLKSAKLVKPLRSCFDEYTYTSLELGCPIWQPVHLTIAYAAAMTEAGRRRLRSRLTFILMRYLMLQPLDRPDELINYRQFEIGQRDVGMQESQPSIHSIHECNRGKIDELLDRDEIVPRMADPSVYSDEEARRALVKHIHERDTGRYRDACVRAMRGQPHIPGSKWLLSDCSIGLGDEDRNPALKDLCHYLSDAVWHFPEAHYYDENRNKKVPPMVLDHTSWHVTQQDNWHCIDWEAPYLELLD